MDRKPVDLTLKLGPPSPEEQNNQDPPVMGIENIDLNNPPPPNFMENPVQDVGRQRRRRVCGWCGSNNTPLWRKGPDGRQTLCNACGLRCMRAIKKGAE